MATAEGLISLWTVDDREWDSSKWLLKVLAYVLFGLCEWLFRVIETTLLIIRVHQSYILYESL